MGSGIILSYCCPLTGLVFPLGLVSPQIHVLVQLELGEEAWVPDKADVTPARASMPWKGTGCGK
jgi:hypothetical protein